MSEAEFDNHGFREIRRRVNAPLGDDLVGDMLATQIVGGMCSFGGGDNDRAILFLGLPPQCELYNQEFFYWY